MIQHYIYANHDGDIVEIGGSTLDGKTRVAVWDIPEAFATYSLIQYRLNHLAGRLLTHCDAIFTDPVQRKANKDFIRTLIADEFGFYGETLQKGIIEDSLKDVENMSDEEFATWTKENPPVDISEVVRPDLK